MDFMIDLIWKPMLQKSTKNDRKYNLVLPTSVIQS